MSSAVTTEGLRLPHVCRSAESCDYCGVQGELPQSSPDRPVIMSLEVSARDPNYVTWHQDGDGSLHGFASDVVQSEHPVGLDVVVS